MSSDIKNNLENIIGVIECDISYSPAPLNQLRYCLAKLTFNAVAKTTKPPSAVRKIFEIMQNRDNVYLKGVLCFISAISEESTWSGKNNTLSIEGYCPNPSYKNFEILSGHGDEK